MDPDLATLVVQCGAAGVIGWMWLAERRSAASREKQLTDAHERILHERTALDVVLRSVEGSTRALTAIEVGQRQLLDLLARAYGVGPVGGAGGVGGESPTARGRGRGVARRMAAARRR